MPTSTDATNAMHTLETPELGKTTSIVPKLPTTPNNTIETRPIDPKSTTFLRAKNTRYTAAKPKAKTALTNLAHSTSSDKEKNADPNIIEKSHRYCVPKPNISHALTPSVLDFSCRKSFSTSFACPSTSDDSTSSTPEPFIYPSIQSFNKNTERKSMPSTSIFLSSF